VRLTVTTTVGLFHLITLLPSPGLRNISKMLRSIILSCGWDVFRLAMACNFFGGLTIVRRLATA